MLLLAPCKTATQGYLHHYCSVFLEPSTARAAQRAGEGRATVLWPEILWGKGHTALNTHSHKSKTGSAWSRGSLTECCAFWNLHPSPRQLALSTSQNCSLCHLCISMEFHCHGVGCCHWQGACHYHPGLLNMVIKTTSQDFQDWNHRTRYFEPKRNKEQQIQEPQKVLTVRKTGSDWTSIDCNTLLSTFCHAPHVSWETSRLWWLAWQQRPTDTVTKTARWLCSQSAVLWIISGAGDQRKGKPDFFLYT